MTLLVVFSLSAVWAQEAQVRKVERAAIIEDTISVVADEEIVGRIDKYWDLIWSNNFAKHPLYLGYSWNFEKTLELPKQSLKLGTVIFTLGVDRVEWFRLTKYQRGEIVFAAYEILNKDYKRMFSDAAYCPVLYFNISYPGMDSMKLAGIDCAEYWIQD